MGNEIVTAAKTPDISKLWRNAVHKRKQGGEMKLSKEIFWTTELKNDAKAYLIKKALEKHPEILKERETKVLKTRFGLLDGKEHTLAQVGQIFKVTSSRIRQIENKALRKLRLI